MRLCVNMLPTCVRLRHVLTAGARRGFAEAAKAPAKQLRLNFYVPHAVIAQDEVVKQVTIPAVDGAFGVLAGHVPTVSEMKPGVVQVQHSRRSSTSSMPINANEN